MGATLPRRLVVVLLVFSINAPWAMIQSIAWTGMLLNFSTQASLPSPIKMTFDGKHSCKMCHLVKEGKAAEKKKERNLQY